MPGPPIDQSGLVKLQAENTHNSASDEERQSQHTPVAEVGELTELDRRNRRLLVALLDRMNKSAEEFEHLMEKDEEESTSEYHEGELNQF